MVHSLVVVLSASMVHSLYMVLSASMVHATFVVLSYGLVHFTFLVPLTENGSLPSNGTLYIPWFTLSIWYSPLFWFTRPVVLSYDLVHAGLFGTLRLRG
jgi:hypothetical protein